MRQRGTDKSRIKQGTGSLQHAISIILIMTALLGLTGYAFVKNLLTKKSQSASISLAEQPGENYDSAITPITDFVYL